eukprot:Clim_evm14s18 gene=Clim_evmTU14s18
MLRAKAISNFLGEVNTNKDTEQDTVTAVLLDNEGSVIAYGGDSKRDEALSAAIVNHIWHSYRNNGSKYLSQELEEFILVFDEPEGACCVCRKVCDTFGFLLVVYSQSTLVPVGNIRARADSLATSLEAGLADLK